MSMYTGPDESIFMFTSGPAAAHIRWYTTPTAEAFQLVRENDGTNDVPGLKLTYDQIGDPYTFCFDWAFDSVYLMGVAKPHLVINLGTRDGLERLTEQPSSTIEIFRTLASHMLSETQYVSSIEKQRKNLQALLHTLEAH